MANSKRDTLRAGHRKALGFEKESEKGEPKISPLLAAYYERHELLRGVPAAVIRKAWFTMAHLTLSPGAHIADMGCEDGAMTYAMAVLNPQLRFTGIDSNRKSLTKAKQVWKAPNLEFRTADLSTNMGFEENTLDAIVNSFILHEVYSDSRFDERPVVHTLEHQFSLLKNDGIMFIRDFALPSGADYVLLEMPDVRSDGNDPETMSEVELLLWYSENARPRDDSGCHGFFVEELPARFPKTRLFRLSYKWAYEFITRKDNRALLKAELPREYTFFTQHEFRKTLRALKARVLYTALHWDDTIIDQKFLGHFRLYNDDGTPMGPPPTSFIAVAQKMGERKSLRLLERRPAAKSQGGPVRITAMRNEVDGRVRDIISRDMDLTEILPYRVTDEGRLNIFIHEALPRAIINAVPRSGKNLDEKFWSGHMTEAIALESHLVKEISKDDAKATVLFARNYLGLKPVTGALLERGPAFYPSPDYIDERVET